MLRSKRKVRRRALQRDRGKCRSRRQLGKHPC